MFVAEVLQNGYIGALTYSAWWLGLDERVSATVDALTWVLQLLENKKLVDIKREIENTRDDALASSARDFGVRVKAW